MKNKIVWLLGIKMENSKIIINSFIIIILITGNFFYQDYRYENQLEEKLERNRTQIIDYKDNYKDKLKKNETKEETLISSGIKKTVIPGDYLLQGFFAHNSFVNVDEDGSVYEFNNYEDMYDKGSSSTYKRYKMDGGQTGWPSSTNTYYYLEEPNTRKRSSMFTPVFSEDTEIAGKIHVLTHFNTDIDDQQVYTLNISLSLFNPSDQNTTQIAYVEEILPDDLSFNNKKVFTLILSDPVIIPKNYRLKLAVMGKVSLLTDDSTSVELKINYSSDRGPYQWQITDEGYTNTYDFDYYSTVFGMQIKYKDLSYPSISITGAENETYYYEEKNINITIQDSTSQSYRWNDNEFTSWEGSETTTSLPKTDGWHYLEVKAFDEFNNGRVNIYKIGYDGSHSDVVLLEPLNNSMIKSGGILNFSVSTGASNVTYQWNNNGTIFDLLSVPEHNIYAPLEEGECNLTIYIDDTFVYEEQFYIFFLDPKAPSIKLVNLLNGTTCSANKLIEVEITDEAEIYSVQYKWDNQNYRTWTAEEGTSSYFEYTPDIDGWNNLTVKAIDEFMQENITVFRFFVDKSELLVELTTMKNDSFYYGGNDVNVTITGYNGTIKFQWDNGEIEDGFALMSNSILVLTDNNALPLDPSCIHYLYIYVGDLSNNEHVFVFKFTLDQEIPVIIPGGEYNNSRHLDTKIFSFQITDNLTIESDLLVYVSIDGSSNQTLSSPFDFYLLGLEDGDYNLTLYAFDKASNVRLIVIYFTIDTFPPIISINSIDGLVELDDDFYIPNGALVDINIVDNDPNANSTYSWDNSQYTTFNSSFFLDYEDGFGILSIQANDTLGNEVIYNISLIIDSVAPETSIIFPFNESKINHYTNLNFQVEDLSRETIESVKYTWSYLSGSIDAILDDNGFVVIKLSAFYNEEGPVTLSFTTKDIVGNTHIFSYIFTVDLSAPTLELHFYDTKTSEYFPATNGSYIRGYYVLWYNDSINDDLESFEYSWNNGILQLLNSSNYIDIPSLDGEQILSIKLQDDTGESTSSNTYTVTYFFIVDDLKIDYISVPDNYPENTSISMKYGDEYSFIVSVSDIEEGTAITGLKYTYIIDEEINLDIDTTQLDSITYEFIITATNITNGEPTPIEIQFWQFEDHKETVQIDVLVDRTEGIAHINSISNHIIYGEDIFINVSLYDTENISSQEITAVFVNGTSVIENTEFGDNNTILIRYSGYPRKKGNYTLNLYIESSFYFDEVKNIASMNVEIQPIPVFLSVYVSNTTVEYGNKLVVYANLTDHNGDPVPFVDIHFYLYIYLNEYTQAVAATPEGFDEMLERITQTNAQGIATLDFDINDTIAYLLITADFKGNDILDVVSFLLEEPVLAVPSEGGIPPEIIVIIVAGSVLLMIIISFIVYKVTRPKSFEEILEEITEEDIKQNIVQLIPGVILSIFDQRKGPTPLLGDYSFESDQFARRMAIGVDNFLLKICDQAYSSLGFEEFDEKRRTGSIRLPNEDMIGYIHGLQLRNKAARGGYENLSLIVVTEEQHGTLLIGKEKYLHQDIDELSKMLQEKKSLAEINSKISVIRQKATQLILAAQIEEMEIRNKE